MGSKEFRESKQAQGRLSEEEKVRENLLLFEKRRMAEKVLTFNKEAEDKLAAGEKISQALKQWFVRARAGSGKDGTGLLCGLKGVDLDEKVASLRGKALTVRLGEEPDGYAPWLAQQDKTAKATPDVPMSEAVPEVDATLTTYDYLETETTLLPIAGTQQPLAVTRPRRGCCSSHASMMD